MLYRVRLIQTREIQLDIDARSGRIAIEKVERKNKRFKITNERAEVYPLNQWKVKYNAPH